MAEWVRLARDRINDVMASEYACVRPELEARIAEAHYRSSGNNIDPHHITTALRELTQTGTLRYRDTHSRGGHRITTIEPTDRHGRSTKIDRAAGRKRVLYARYLSWALGNKANPHGYIGTAGEAAVRQAVIQSTALQPAARHAEEVSQLHGVDLGGPLDSAGYLTTSKDGSPILSDIVTVLFEVKNIRNWIYPSAEELYQVLGKAVLLQTAAPMVNVLPILICRRVHETTYWMGGQLGFLTIELEGQYVGPVPQDQVNDLRSELHFTDLIHGSGPSRIVEKRIRQTLPKVAYPYSQKWRTTVSDSQIASAISALRYTKSGAERYRASQALKELCKRNLGVAGW